MVNKVFDEIMGPPIFGSPPYAGTIPLVVSFASFFFVIFVLMKIVIDKYTISISYVILFLFAYGIGRFISRALKGEHIVLTIASIMPPWIFKLILPITITSLAFRLGSVKFLSISQTLHITLIGSLWYLAYFSTSLVVFFCVYSLCFNWTKVSLFILTFSLVLFQPEMAINKLDSKGSHVKYLQALLKFEILWDVMISFTMTDVLLKYRIIPIYEESNATELFFFTIKQFLGIIVGIIFGFIIHIFYKYAANDLIITSILPLTTSILVFSVAELLGSSGCAAACSFSITITIVKKPKLKSDDEFYFQHIWGIIYLLTAAYIMFMTGFILGAVDRDRDFRMFCFAFGIFVFTILARSFYNFLIYPILYGRSTKWTEVALSVVGPYRGMMSLLVVLRYAVKDGDEGYQILVIITLIVVMSVFFNIVLLDWFLKRLDVFQLSKPQISNMNMAVEQINKCRGQMLFAEKMDRLIGDANWAIVNRITGFSHPYKSRMKMNEFGDSLKEDIKTVECPKCGSWFVAPPTKKELDQITRESKFRVLKAQQVSYLKQRESGTLTHFGYKFLSNIMSLASYSNEISANTDDLRINAEDLKCIKKMEAFFENITNLTVEYYNWQPTNRFRKKCFHLVTSKTFKFIMAIISLVDMFLCLSLLYLYVNNENGNNKGTLWPPAINTFGKSMSIMAPSFYFLNILEYILQVIGLGVMQYFSRRVYVIEFFSCIVIRSLQMSLFFEQCIHNSKFMNVINCQPVVVYMNFLMFLRLTRVYLFFVSLIPAILMHIRRNVEGDLLKRYDIGKAYLLGLDRVSKYLSRLITNEQVLEEIKKDIEANRLKVTKELGIIQRECPTIAITVKTKHAIRHVINGMSDCAVGMQDEGILDNIEYTALNNSIDKVRSKLSCLDVIYPSSPVNIMKEIPWLQGDIENTELFLEEAQMSNYDYNDVLIRHGDDPVGLYILVSGLLKATYVPSLTSIQLAAKFGVVPNYDFFENFKFDQSQEDFIVSGNVIGELGVVTGRRYDMTIVAETAVQVYYIPWYVMKSFYDTTNGQYLIGKIWKKVSVKIAVVLLQFVDGYRHWTSERLIGFLMKGFVPNLTGVVAVNIDHRVEEAILIEGVAKDINNFVIIYGPYRIPKTVTKLLLPEHKSWDFQTVYPTKLYIVPVSGNVLNDLFETQSEEVMPYEAAKNSDGNKQRKKKMNKTRKVGFTEELDEILSSQSVIM